MPGKVISGQNYTPVYFPGFEQNKNFICSNILHVSFEKQMQHLTPPTLPPDVSFLTMVLTFFILNFDLSLSVGDTFSQSNDTGGISW